MGKPHKTTGIEKINIKGLEVTDKEIIAEKRNEHFVSIGDRLAKEYILMTSSMPLHT